MKWMGGLEDEELGRDTDGGIGVWVSGKISGERDGGVDGWLDGGMGGETYKWRGGMLDGGRSGKMVEGWVDRWMEEWVMAERRNGWNDRSRDG